MQLTEDRITVGAESVHFRVRSDQSAGTLVAFDVRIPAGGGPPMLHRHDPFELYRVEEGELAFYLEDDQGVVRRRVAGGGEVVSIPGGREHTVRNESESEAGAFVVLSPGTSMEGFARAVGEQAGSGHPDVSGIIAAAAAHGIEITRPVEEVA